MREGVMREEVGGEGEYMSLWVEKGEGFELTEQIANPGRHLAHELVLARRRIDLRKKRQYEACISPSRRCNGKRNEMR